ncbi:MAG: LptA/OstA family protein [Rhizobiaceae bacterium]|nr:LptA/OstA family protein [Rhizobiaceae bacterium]MCV0405001.1 LptA/OstA family protein [Rhizobiaceae bacterium]
MMISSRRRGPALLSTAVLIGLLSVSGAAGQQNQRMTGLQLDGDQPIQIESDRLEVRENENIAIFTGNVNVVQGQTQLKAGRMTVYYSPNGNGTVTGGTSSIERLEVENKVYLRSENQVATGDSGTFNMLTEEMVLLGKEVVLTEDDNIVVGCKLTVHMATGQARLDSCEGGRVRTLLSPQSRNSN